MADLFEVVLHGVAKNDLLSLLRFFEINSEKITDLSFSESLDVIYGSSFDKNLVEAISNYRNNLCVTANLYRFKVLGSLIISFLLLRVIKYESGIDVELCFDNDEETGINEIMMTMKDYTNRLADKFHIKEFYGGLEPAIDMETRYFTNNNLGPLAAR